MHELGLVLFTNCLLKIFGEVKRLMILFRGHGLQGNIFMFSFLLFQMVGMKKCMDVRCSSDAMFLWCLQGGQTFWCEVINIMFVAGTSLIIVMIIKGLITYLLAALVMKFFS